MKTWLHVHGLRRQHSDAALPNQRYNSSATRNVQYNPSLPADALTDTAAKIAASKTASRMSIERYLQAPLEDEPASVPAINAALKEKRSPAWSDQNRNPGGHRRGHSRGTSYDANSEGRRTFYTSASGQESTGTSFSVGLRSNHNQSNAHPMIPKLPKLHTVTLMHNNLHSPEEPTTGRTLDSERTLTDQHDASPPGKSVDSAYRARIEAELVRIQQKARRLEEEMRRYNEQKDNEELLVPRITNEMAYQQMASKPKLAWILGGDNADSSGMERPKTSASVTADASNNAPSRPATSGRVAREVQEKVPRKSKSSSILLEETHRSNSRRRAVLMGRTSSKRPKFYCTFCQKRFHSRAEWVSHEKNIHMPEELWVCCPRTGETPDHCPFCAQSKPSASHLNDHNYFSCQNKPLSERTFNRKDYFLQHIAQEHNVSAGQKPLRLTQLVEAWRRPLPLEQGHPALHCGFCGLTFSAYADRTQHVTGHFMNGVDMMSWWSERKSHHVTPPVRASPNNPNLPCQCCYCNRTFATLDVALRTHPTCNMWSCSFLPGMQYTIYPSGSDADLEAVCCYCNESLSRGNGKVKGTILKEHVSTHNFRGCNQRLYFSAQQFRQHLQDNHRINYDGTLFAGWTLLLKSSKKESAAVFEAVDESPRRAYTDPVVAAPKQQGKKANAVLPEPKLNFMDFSETPQFAPKKKIRRKASSQTMPDPTHEAVRDSTIEFTRAATIDFAHRSGAPASRPTRAGRNDQQHKPVHIIASHTTNAAASGLEFFRRRLDGSMRNRLYVRNEAEGPLTKNSLRLFRKVPGSTFGSLVLHSSLLGATPARLTNSVDIYTLH